MPKFSQPFYPILSQISYLNCPLSIRPNHPLTQQNKPLHPLSLQNTLSTLLSRKPNIQKNFLNYLSQIYNST
nr:MAG TPA: hypothetical protein [Bacteriophage sp.]